MGTLSLASPLIIDDTSLRQQIINVVTLESCKNRKEPPRQVDGAGAQAVGFWHSGGYTGEMEFCYEDENGRLTDAGMFGDLDQVDSPATQRATLKQLRKQGLSDEAIRHTWPGLTPLLASRLGRVKSSAAKDDLHAANVHRNDITPMSDVST